MQQKSRGYAKKSRRNRIFRQTVTPQHKTVTKENGRVTLVTPPSFCGTAYSVCRTAVEPEPCPPRRPSDSRARRGEGSPIFPMEDDRGSVRLYYSITRRRCQDFLVTFGNFRVENSSRFFDRTTPQAAAVSRAVTEADARQPFPPGVVSAGSDSAGAVSAEVAPS